MTLIMQVHRHRDGEKGSQCGENRKGCVMGFPYQCLATAILTSCPAGLAGICRLTPLPSPDTPDPQADGHTCELCSSQAGTASFTGSVFSLTCGYTLMHHLRQGSCFLSVAQRLYTSCLSFPSDFPQELLRPFIIKLSAGPLAARSRSV